MNPGGIKPGHCANCGEAGVREYCPACGQEANALPSVYDFFSETVLHLLSLESKAWRTLAKLFLAPGVLTVEYMVGRRARYIRPSRLFLWISVLVIACVETLDLQPGLRFGDGEGLYLFELAPQSASKRYDDVTAELRPMQLVLDHLDTPALRRFKALPAVEQRSLVMEWRHQSTQYFVIALVPVFALFMALCYRNRKRSYAEHLVFYLHAQSFLLIALLVEAPMPDPVAAGVTLWVIVYFLLAARRVYGGSWLDNLLRSTAAMLLNVFSFTATGIALVYLLLCQ